MDAAQITTIIVALCGSGGGLVVLGKAILDWKSGKTERVRAANADMKQQRDDAYQLADDERDRATAEQRRADFEAHSRNRWADHAAVLRRMLLDRGVSAADIPPSPQIKQTLRLQKE